MWQCQMTNLVNLLSLHKVLSRIAILFNVQINVAIVYKVLFVALVLEYAVVPQFDTRLQYTYLCILGSNAAKTKIYELKTPHVNPLTRKLNLQNELGKRKLI